MASDTVKALLVAAHLLAGIAAVTVLLATGHLDSTTGGTLLGSLLGVGVGGGLSLLNPTPAGVPAVVVPPPTPTVTPAAPAPPAPGPAQ